MKDLPTVFREQFEAAGLDPTEEETAAQLYAILLQAAEADRERVVKEAK